MEHYANCFSLQSERCFPDDPGRERARPALPNITEWRGRFKDGAGKRHTVEACNGHRADLDAVQRIGGSAPLRTGLPRSR